MAQHSQQLATLTEGEILSCLAANLKLACGYHRSVSDVCRKIGINRSQFMKYLSAESFPSRRNLRRICDFFGCDEVEMMMAPELFVDLIRLRPGVNLTASRRHR